MTPSQMLNKMHAIYSIFFIVSSSSSCPFGIPSTPQAERGSRHDGWSKTYSRPMPAAPQSNSQSVSAAPEHIFGAITASENFFWAPKTCEKIQPKITHFCPNHKPSRVPILPIILLIFQKVNWILKLLENFS
jgi:hypothetical protein